MHTFGADIVLSLSLTLKACIQCTAEMHTSSSAHARMGHCWLSTWSGACCDGLLFWAHRLFPPPLRSFRSLTPHVCIYAHWNTQSCACVVYMWWCGCCTLFWMFRLGQCDFASVFVFPCSFCTCKDRQMLHIYYINIYIIIYINIWAKRRVCTYYT